MSLPWPEHLAARLVPRQGSAADPDGALDAFDQSLPRARRAGGALSVIVSDHFVRYVAFESADALHGEDETVEYARFRFGSVYGDAARGWRICVSRKLPGAARVAAAVDAALVDALAARVRAKGWKLEALEPALAGRYDRLRRQLRAAQGWFALAEAGRLSALRFCRGAVTDIFSVSAARGPGEELAAQIERRMLAAGDAAPGEIYLYGFADRDALMLPFAWKTTRLTGAAGGA